MLVDKVIHEYLNLRIATLKLDAFLGLQGSKGERPKDQKDPRNGLIREKSPLEISD